VEGYLLSDSEGLKRFVWLAVIATVLTGIVGEALNKVIEHTIFKGAPPCAAGGLVRTSVLSAPALLAAGILILVAGLVEGRRPDSEDRRRSALARQP